MFNLGVFFPRRQPLVLYEGIVLWLCITCVFSEQETCRETLRENKGYYSRSTVGCVSSFFLDNRKEGLAVWGGHIANWVNQVYLCLSSFMCFVCLYFSAYFMCCIAL